MGVHATKAAALAGLSVAALLAGCSSSGHAKAPAGPTTSSPSSAQTSAAEMSSAQTSSAQTSIAQTSSPASAASASGSAGGPAQVDITFSGAVTGHLDNPVKGPKYACGTPTYPDLWVINDVEGSVAGVPYALHLDVNNFTGQGKQTGNVIIDVTPVGKDPSSGYLSVEPPTVTFDDPTSGSVDGDAQQGLDSPAPTVHVKGTFHC
jgi:hypothetical protein